MWIYGTNPVKQRVFQSAHLAELAWLAIPEGHKIHVMRKLTNEEITVNATGSILYIGVTIEEANEGTFSVSVDDEAPTHYAAGAPKGMIATHLGRTSAPALIRISHFPAGSHFVCIRGTVQLDWIAGLSGERHPGWPSVYASSVPPNARYGDDGYSQIIARNVGLLRHDGLNVSFTEIPKFDLKNDIAEDKAHPLDSGFAKIFRAFHDVVERN
ncbi:MAG: hypothetical protein JO099_09065 [Acidobacteriia bacterium]|nr:hypothetical protein [Terriglobia bacterium]